jgi:hypothetical protein
MTKGKPEKGDPNPPRSSIFDPVVIAALVGLLGGGVTLTLTSDDARERQQIELAEKREQAKCDRAFAFLQDHEVSPKLEKDDAFYQSQRKIADHCSLERKKP